MSDERIFRRSRSARMLWYRLLVSCLITFVSVDSSVIIELINHYVVITPPWHANWWQAYGLKYISGQNVANDRLTSRVCLLICLIQAGCLPPVCRLGTSSLPVYTECRFETFILNVEHPLQTLP